MTNLAPPTGQRLQTARRETVFHPCSSRSAKSFPFGALFKSILSFFHPAFFLAVNMSSCLICSCILQEKQRFCSPSTSLNTFFLSLPWMCRLPLQLCVLFCFLFFQLVANQSTGSETVCPTRASVTHILLSGIELSSTTASLWELRENTCTLQSFF